MILVTGATGNIGAEVVRLLLAAGEKVRVLARDPSKAAHLADRAEVVQGDLLQPDSLAAAFAGAERAFVLIGSINDIPAAAGPIFRAAEAAGVRHVVFQSSATIQMRPPNTVGAWHLAGEEALKGTRLAWTMLRPGNFASNSLRWAGPIRAQGSVFAPHGTQRSSVIDPRDIAAVAALALTRPGHEGKTYVLTGPEVISTTEQIDILAAALGKPIRFVQVPVEGARAGMIKAGTPEAIADAVLELMRPESTLEPMLTATVEDVTGRPARPYALWARDHAHLFA